MSFVGDKASVTVSVSAGGNSGLFVDSDFSAGGILNELRYIYSSGTFQGSWGSTFVGSTDNPLLIKAEVTSVNAGTIGLDTTISGTGITTATESFTLATSSLNFGPVAFNANGSNVAIDNLTFSTSAVPEPSTIALLLSGGIGLVLRRRRNS